MPLARFYSAAVANRAAPVASFVTAAHRRWLPGCLLPWNCLFFAVAALFWFWLTPPTRTLKTPSPGWIAYLLVRNSALVLALFGALELRLYVKRWQGVRFKYNGKWPSKQPSDVFWFKTQNVDNALRTFASGVPLWTAYEVIGLWAYANGWGAWSTVDCHPFWLVVFPLLLPIYHEPLFYRIHRLIHVPLLYKWVHSAHHNSVNPSPRSSLSMLPVERLLYLSDFLIHLVLPSHPSLLLFNLQITGTGAVVGHVGLNKIEVGANAAIDTHPYAHYLHHKYFEVNYADCTTSLDKLFGTWHDGTKAGDVRIQLRFEQRRARLVSRQQSSHGGA